MNPGVHTMRTKKRKRPRSIMSWEDSFRRIPNPSENERQSPKSSKKGFGLVDLFGKNRWVCPSPISSDKSFRRFPISKNHTDCKPPTFFTLRMEHRTGGAIAKHDGEERILIFRSDQAGAIAKIIFSSVPAHSDIPSSTKDIQSSAENRRIAIAANATIHFLFVKDEYRGFDLGGLLFSLCTTYLRERYSNKNHAFMSSIRCYLEAEEDVCRHDKLVHFYEHLGLRKRRRANKPTFLNNNDGETYRRIPMKMDLLVAPDQSRTQQSNSSKSEAVQGYSSFLPAMLVSSTGEYAKVDEQCIESWLIIEYEDGTVDLRTSDGRMLVEACKGKCKFAPTESNSSISGSFQLLRISDSLDKVQWNREQKDTSEQEGEVRNYGCANEKELWMLRLPITGMFLGLTSDVNLIISPESSFWQVDENFCLTHTSDSPARRQHHRRMWETQSVAYVSKMKEKHATFSMCTMKIKEALDLMQNLLGNPFSMTGIINDSNLPSARTLLFHTAELARKEGHPDWVQFVALVHGLAGALKCANLSESMQTNYDSSHSDDDEGGYDWTIYVDARVMGCKPSENSTFHEFRHLNPDRDDIRYNTKNGMYKQNIGLEHVHLSWTSGEYMYHMLKHNGVSLPTEAYAILKLFALVDWHKRGKHLSLANEADEEAKPFVIDFHDIFVRSSQAVMSSSDSSMKELNDNECNELWTNHYSRIARKYGAGGALKW